ncbi:glycosyltransferase family protein [Noviherbaspirillum suwonense]|uniref:Methyltransferase domain-containing protein n=1 Tax=Noviherbaspirillum suwonense TaxID=1224511 RepID=A0ABY1PSK6_9BURK|nr:methyltransferase domain-containing protein [Noviherbaspirillum suwonense]SMP42102.1 Methyltransferase domain-containing protein [Noviherbaspirillum suwonense]
MAHLQQRNFCESVKLRFPQYFSSVFALDIGSLDINGNNQFLFDSNSIFLGVDVAIGRNVDVVCSASNVKLPDQTFDTIVSTECLEHDRDWVATLHNSIRLLRGGGLLLLTCATTGRPEHGTRRTTPQDAPLLAAVDDEWADYYRNLTEQDIRNAVNVDQEFQFFEFSVNHETKDLYFFGIKKGLFENRRDRSINLPSHPVRILQNDLESRLQRAFEELHSTRAQVNYLVSQLKNDENRELIRDGKAEQDFCFGSKIVSEELELAKDKINSLEALLKSEVEHNFSYNEKIEEYKKLIDSLNEKLDAESVIREQLQNRANRFEEELIILQSSVVQFQSSHSEVSQELAKVYRSKSWAVTHPLRAVMTTANAIPNLSRRVRNGIRYIAKGDFDGLKKRVRYYRTDSALQSSQKSGPPQRWGVMATLHTLFIAELVAKRLRHHGWEVDILTSSQSEYLHDMYIVICPQMFDVLPPGEKRICYQMEQSVTSRWFKEDYLNTLENSLAVLDYALSNIEYMSTKGISYPHVHYLPVGANASYSQNFDKKEKIYDILFYGDAKSSPRRNELLKYIRKHFNVKICGDTFGPKMVDEILSARVVVNIHYYENALLEMPRIQECLSLGIPVVSESAQDQANYPEIEGGVIFFDQGNQDEMIKALQNAIENPQSISEVQAAAYRGEKLFDFMFDRFLVAMNFLPSSYIQQLQLPLPNSSEPVALSLPETVVRRNIFNIEKPKDCLVFSGIRRHPGWIGCGLSYKALAQHAVRTGKKQLTVMEDDVLLPSDYDVKLSVIRNYLSSKKDEWDVFAGVIALLHPETKILAVEIFDGVTFLTIDRMTSMVFNIYNEKALRILATWNPENIDPHTNTIDRFIESQINLKVVVALPFFVGHREDVHSTLWGFQNSHYLEIIGDSEKKLMSMLKEYNLKH